MLDIKDLLHSSSFSAPQTYPQQPIFGLRECVFVRRWAERGYEIAPNFDPNQDVTEMQAVTAKMQGGLVKEAALGGYQSIPGAQRFP